MISDSVKVFQWIVLLGFILYGFGC